MHSDSAATCPAKSTHGHDEAPSEVEAEKGAIVFRAFNSFVNITYGEGSIESLFNSNLDENKKIDILSDWWNSYQESRKQRASIIIDNFSNMEEGTYIWNGCNWVKQ